MLGTRLAPDLPGRGAVAYALSIAVQPFAGCS